MQRKHRILGTVLGQAIGDALGGQTEFTRKPNNVSDLGPTWGYKFPAFSDDTQMALAIAEGLLESSPTIDSIVDFESSMEVVSRCFVEWAAGRWGANNRSPGPACMSGVSRLRGNVADWKQTGGLQAKGNGGVMRVAYVGCYFAQNPGLAFSFGALSSVPTHANLESLLSSGSMAYLVASSIQGKGLRQSLTGLFRLLENPFPRLLWTPPDWKPSELSFTIARLAAAYHCAKSHTVYEFHTDVNGNDGKTVECLAAAIHANARYSNYGDIITSLANNTQDSDSTAAVGGALAGARFGYGFIRSDWRKRVETSEYLHQLADRLYDASEGIKAKTAVAEIADTAKSIIA